MHVSLASTVKATSLAKGAIGFYTDLVNAIQRKKPKALASLISKDFEANAPSGEVGDRERWLSDLSAEFTKWNYSQITIQIDKLRHAGDVVVVYLTRRIASNSLDRTNPTFYWTTAIIRDELYVGDRRWQLRSSDTISREVLIDGSAPSPKEVRLSEAMMQMCGNRER